MYRGLNQRLLRHTAVVRKEDNKTMSKPRSETEFSARYMERPRTIHWVFLLSCALFYLLMMAMIIFLFIKQSTSSSPSAGYYWLGTLAQFQVIAVVAITLNPVPKSYRVGIALCCLSILATLQGVLLGGMIHALPGIIIPINIMIIVIIINRYKTKSVDKEKQLARSGKILQQVLDTIPMPIFWKDLNSTFMGSNRVFAEDIGKQSTEEIIGKDDCIVPALLDLAVHRAEDIDVMKTGIQIINREDIYNTIDNKTKWIKTTKAPLRDADGHILGMLGVFENITSSKLAEQALYYEKERLRITLLSIADAVITTDAQGRITLINSVAEALSGWPAQDALGQDIGSVLILESETQGEQPVNPIAEVLRTGSAFSLTNHTSIVSREGVRRIIEDSAAPILAADGGIRGAVMVFRDVTEKKRKQDEILYLSYHDSLTSLYNRRYIEENIQTIGQAEHCPLSVIMGDINGLKTINERLGHTEGDRFLMETSRLLTAVCRPRDLVARWGGDEFIMLLPNTGAAQAEQICEAIREKSAALSPESLSLSISLGCATYTDASAEIARTINAAEENMYTQKLLNSRSYRNSILESFRKTLFEKSHETEEHANRLQILCRKMGIALGLPQTSLQELELLGAMHDIGKIGVPDSIINKPGKLTPDEWVIMKQHCEIGARLTQSIPEFVRVSDYILSHHERWDATGYPRGLSGEAIPLLARILCIVDAFDAMTSNRSYRDPVTPQAAVQELLANAGSQFDPELVRLFVNEKIYETETNPA